MACVHSLLFPRTRRHALSRGAQVVVFSRLKGELSNAVAAVGSRQLGSRQDGGWMRVCLAVFNLVDPECDRSVREGERILRMLLEWSEDVLQDFGPAAGWRKQSRG